MTVFNLLKSSMRDLHNKIARGLGADKVSIDILARPAHQLCPLTWL